MTYRVKKARLHSVFDACLMIPKTRSEIITCLFSKFDEDDKDSLLLGSD
jgi:hypothetical protein